MFRARVYERFEMVVSPSPEGPSPDVDEPKWEIPENPPPDYANYRLNETKYPQHNPDLPFPEGRTGKYVYFSGHITGALNSW